MAYVFPLLKEEVRVQKKNVRTTPKVTREPLVACAFTCKWGHLHLEIMDVASSFHFSPNVLCANLTTDQKALQHSAQKYKLNKLLELGL